MMPGAEKMSRYRIDGGDLAGLSALLVKARAKSTAFSPRSGYRLRVVALQSHQKKKARVAAGLRMFAPG
jgi:hypothetical protein